ncbi:hypothetical protein [Rufibacter roseolus]|nr:hypothetical protein [Rufibacter roseolus]
MQQRFGKKAGKEPFLELGVKALGMVFALKRYLSLKSVVGTYQVQL